MLQPFDPNVKTKVLTDASLLHDIGFALVQVYKDMLALIQCGSASLSPTQSRYSTVELECLAVVNAIQKCHYYLAGITRFEVWTDHRPLVGAFKKHLHLLHAYAAKANVIQLLSHLDPREEPPHRGRSLQITSIRTMRDDIQT